MTAREAAEELARRRGLSIDGEGRMRRGYGGLLRRGNTAIRWSDWLRNQPALVAMPVDWKDFDGDWLVEDEEAGR
jgi:hypothetical protein